MKLQQQDGPAKSELPQDASDLVSQTPANLPRLLSPTKPAATTHKRSAARAGGHRNGRVVGQLTLQLRALPHLGLFLLGTHSG